MTPSRTARRRGGPALLLVMLLLLGGCGAQEPRAAQTAEPTASPTAVAETAAPSPAQTPSPVPEPTSQPAPPAPTPLRTPEPPADEPAAQVRQTVPYRVELRTDDAATADFRETLHAVLTDERGWARAGFDFVQDPDAPYAIVLAEGPEVDELCLPMQTWGTYSCQNGPVVALNADRWRSATPQWTGDLQGYRVMLINHEVGHLLHLHHPTVQCPAPGLPAPVMSQQSTELGECLPNPWPLQWEVDLAAERREPLAPPADHDPSDHRPTPPPVDR